MTAKRTFSDAALRFGDWGPGYVCTDDESVSFGFLRLRPGDAFPNHYHERHTESFLVIAGEAEIWLDRSERLTLRLHELVSCAPHVQHYLRNVADREFVALFVKTPGVPGDKVDAPWTPEEGR